MVTITVLGIGLLSLAGLFPLAMRRATVGEMESRATFHAEAKLEELKVLPWSALKTAAAADTLAGTFARSWMVTEDAPAPGMKQVEVTVRWTDNRGPRDVTLSSFLSDSGI
jgi:hypothetical protein